MPDLTLDAIIGMASFWHISSINYYRFLKIIYYFCPVKNFAETTSIFHVIGEGRNTKPSTLTTK